MVTAASIDFVRHITVNNSKQAMTISASVLPDDVVFEIFCYYKKEESHRYPAWNWHILVHICRRWRQIAFTSPLRLDMRILCTSRNIVGKNMCIWPALPICIDFGYLSDRRYGNNASSEETSSLHSSTSIVCKMSSFL